MVTDFVIGTALAKDNCGGLGLGGKALICGCKHYGRTRLSSAVTRDFAVSLGKSILNTGTKRSALGCQTGDRAITRTPHLYLMSLGGISMNGIIYLVGLVVVVLAILTFLGLR